MKPQTARILSFLKTGRSLTPLQALGRFGCLRLAPRVYELRKAGYSVESERVSRGGKRFARYRMGTETRRA